jgi:glycosyltransferase involved in cell wall biosynthesis
MEPLVSIIIPCYNYGRFLPDCLRSLISQEFTSWECLLVDNGSTDDTNEICRKFCAGDKRFILIETANEGPSAGRNAGIVKARGKYIQLLDADDLLQKNKLELQSKLLESGKYDLVYGPAYYFEEDIDPESVTAGNADWMPCISGSGKRIINRLLLGNIFPINAPLFSKSLIEKSGLMDAQLRGYEDWDLFLRFAINGARIYFADEPETLALIRKHNASLSRSPHHMDIFRAVVLQKIVFEKNLPFTSRLLCLFRYLQQRSQLLVMKFRVSGIRLINSDKITNGKVMLLNFISILYLPCLFYFSARQKSFR